MRILASNPDTIGDMVLREPLYRALTEAGHELLLIVRPSVLPLVRFVAPTARTLVLPTEVYRDDLDAHWGEFSELFAAARGFQPEVLLVAPYRWTRFEERLADELRDVGGLRRIGMSGQLYAGDPHAGHAAASRMSFDVVAQVTEGLAEAEKNAALAAVVLGAPLTRPDPIIQPEEAGQAAAVNALARLGLEPGGYWIACVTGTANVPIKAWHAEGWARVLSDLAERHGRRFLFIGLPNERPAAEAVRELMGAHAERSAIWMEPGETLPTLIALTALSAGYVGHDTGPMHLAAAAGKPVLAVFGGGTWPRFLPRVTPSVSITVGVPCAGCGWSCAFETSHCIKDVPAEEVLRAADDLTAGRMTGREARVIEPGHALQQRMIRENAGLLRERIRDLGDVSRRVRELEPGGNDALRRERDEKAAEAAALAASLEQRSAELADLRSEAESVSREAAGAIAQLAEREAALVRLRGELEAAAAEADAMRSAATGANDRATALAAEAEALRERLNQAESRVRALEAPTSGRPPRRPWRQVLTDAITGSREHQPWRRPRPMPKITVAVPVRPCDTPANVRATVDAILAQAYPHLDLALAMASGEEENARAIAGACDGAPTRVVWVDASRAVRPIAPYASVAAAAPLLPTSQAARGKEVASASTFDPFGAIAKAFASSDADVLTWLEPGDTLEPGALLRAGAYYQARPRAVAVYFENTAERGGWRFPAPPRPPLDVSALLALDGPINVSFFLRRHEYALLGPIDPAKGWAAGWELMARYGRRYGLRRGRGYVACRPAKNEHASPTLANDLAPAKLAFLATFGVAGRLRVRAIHAANRLFHRLRDRGPAGRLTFGQEPGAGPLASGHAPAFVAGQPVSPLTGRLPDRLLFTGRDVHTADAALHRVYYDSASDVALAYPPIDAAALAALHAAREAARAGGIVAGEGDRVSPFASYRGRRRLHRLLGRIPSPYWWFVKPNFQDQTADRLLAILRPLAAPGDAAVRFLNVGCYEGVLLDRLKDATQWTLAGTETNPRAAAAARGKGHVVYETSAQDAPMAIPIGQQFDVLFLSGLAEHLDDPVHTLRRLRQLIVPGGLIVLNQPNLDSALLDLFGPTWCHWQLPHHRAIMGRRGLARLARAADLRLARLRTYTDPYPATISAQINALGLAATVPDDARFPDEISSRGVRLTGWARLLWDWRGRGDYTYAVLRAR